MNERKKTLLSLGLLIITGFVFFQGSDCECGCEGIRCPITLNVWNNTTIPQTFTYNGETDKSVSIPPGGKETITVQICIDQKKNEALISWKAGFWCSVDKVFKTQCEGSQYHMCGSQHTIFID